MGRREEMIKRVKALMPKREKIRNIGIVAHIDHGKTTLSDNLIAGAGMMSEELAGKQLVLDFHKDEQERGITINAGNISIVNEYNGDDYLINLIDTPGHVDFSGEVTRAMRAVDGVVVVVCAVEGVMPQTETVLRQALKEKVKPVLFINKVDRLLTELQLGPEEVQQRFAKVIAKVNSLIKKYAPPEFKDKWQVNPMNGTVAFGSAYHNWAISMPFMQRSGVSFKDVYEYIQKEDQKGLAKKAPLHEVVLEMVINHLPNPVEAQKYRIPTIWTGDPESEVGRAMVNCDPNGPLVFMATYVVVDPHAGVVVTGRVFSGTLKPGQKVWLINANTQNTIQQVGVYMGPERLNVDEVTAGNIAAVIGLKDAYSGETVALEKIEPFEPIKHFSEPVVTKSIEAKNPADLPKLVETLRIVAKEDPNIKVEINEETGEHLISGMGELHLEIIENRIKTEKGLEVVTSKPIVVYRETVMKQSPTVEGKSPNRHNRLYFVVEPLDDAIWNAINTGEISQKDLKDSKALAKKLVELGMSNDEAKRVWDIYNGNILVDMTKGIQYLNETKELIIQGFREAMDRGPLSHEKVTKVKVKLVDAKLHEDAVHRGPAQILPAVRNPIYAAMLQANAVLLEPKQKLFVNIPQELMGAVTKDIQARRGQIINMEQEEDAISITAKVPIAEMFGFAGDIRSATQGKALWTTEYLGYEKLPDELQKRIISEIRKRKGLPPEPPTYKDFVE